jgi:hypothetical protein
MLTKVSPSAKPIHIPIAIFLYGRAICIKEIDKCRSSCRAGEIIVPALFMVVPSRARGEDSEGHAQEDYQLDNRDGRRVQTPPPSPWHVKACGR